MNAIEAFRNMTFEKPEPKASARERYLALVNDVCAATCQMVDCLSVLNDQFRFKDDSFLSDCVVDRSLASYLKSNHVVLRCAGNGPLAHVGDAYLSLHVAKKTFSPIITAQLMQKHRENITCEKHLCAFYDSVFGNHNVIVRWQSPNDVKTPTSRQRAEFIEALIGAFHLASYNDACLYLCDLIWEHHMS